MRATTPKDLRDLMIVRCKDCKHRPLEKDDPNFWEWYGKDCKCPWFCADTYYLAVPADDFFCAYGERGET